MGKVIKVIDLLNMIAKGEKLPKKIRYLKREYIRQIADYKNELQDIYLFSEELTDITAVLHDKVEILDEEQEIDIQSIEKIDGDYLDGNIRSTNLWTNREKAIIKQQNIILEAVKQLDNKINKLESNT